MNYIFEYAFYLTILLITVYAVSKMLNISPAQHQYASLDGLRGVCAALVALFHLYWRAGGESDLYWSLDYLTSGDVKRAIFLTGELSVGVFFMLSGFLFFKKALADSFDYKRFFCSRLLRIYPPAIATLCLIYAVTLFINPAHPAPFEEWFLRSLPFIFTPPAAEINGIPLQIATSGVFWTLVWELRLYLLIPLFYLIMKKVKYKSAFIVFLMLMVLGYKYAVKPEQYLSYLMYFLAGFLAATLKITKRPSETVGVLLLLAALIFTRHAYNTTTPLYMFIVFYTIKNGCSWFGFLTSRPVQLLGTCSFSLYLVHGIAQTLAKHYLFHAGGYVWQSVAIVITGIIAPLMYKFVESRCIVRKKAPVLAAE